jgi:glutamate/tyrosine decarboxylase-like PLP-dependent enzyme
VRVLVGAERHPSVDLPLRFLGLGDPGVVPADERGRIRPDALADALEGGDAPTIVVLQAGNIHSGDFDPFAACVAAAREHGAWVHVDGAFGLWAAATESLRGYMDGAERADSWSTDAHKWLNVPYDSGLVFTAHPDSHSAAFSARAAYLIVDDEKREQVDWNPEHSRRARGFAVYAAIRSLGRSGIAELLERTCAHAKTFAARLEVMGAELLNSVELNQVLFRFPDDAHTEAVLAGVQESGEAWMSGTVWNGRPAIRISVSNWQTSDDDVERALAAFRSLAPA